MAKQGEVVARADLVGGGQTNLHSHAVPDIPITSRASSTDQIIPSGYSGFVVGDYEIGNGLVLELATDGVLEIG